MKLNKFCSMSGDKTGTGPDDKETQSEAPETDKD